MLLGGDGKQINVTFLVNLGFSTLLWNTSLFSLFWDIFSSRRSVQLLQNGGRVKGALVHINSMWAMFSLTFAGVLPGHKYLWCKWMLTEKSHFHITQVNYHEMTLSLTNLASSRNEHLLSLPKIHMSRSQTQNWWNWQVWFLRSVGHKGGACTNGIRDLGRGLGSLAASSIWGDTRKTVVCETQGKSLPCKNSNCC